MNEQSSVYVAGGSTLIGAALLRELRRHGISNVINFTEAGEPDLTDPTAVEAFFKRTKPEYVFLVAGKSAGIRGNQKYPADLIRENLLTECHVIHAAYAYRVQKLLYVASSCCYPRDCPQPMRVESLMTGRLESTSESYAMAKLAGITLCQAYTRQHGARFVSGIAADVFGPGDDFSPEDSHVIPALLRKMHEAKISGMTAVEVWGTGRVRREFVFADDLADACLLVMRGYDEAQPINLGGGTSASIGEIADRIRGVVGYPGELRYDASKPEGMPLKTLDSSKLLSMWWRPRHSIEQALTITYDWFRKGTTSSRRSAEADL
ncbi:MAG: GDP-L-fucose synthase family protein [bacterium]